jgi:hypothetical protein
MLLLTSPTAPPSRKYFRIAEAAAYLNVSVAFLRKYKGLGQGPKFSKLGDLIVYNIDDLDAWVKSNQVEFKAA